MPQFHVNFPDGSDIVHELAESTITIGRLADNTMQIEDASVSSHHAELTLGEAGDYILTDIGSTNGTLLNGREIAEGEGHPLQDGDKVRFGHIETAYQSDNPAEARAMPEAEEVTVVPASSSVRPADFSNASPFQTKKKKKDPMGMAIIGFSVLAILAFLGSVFMIFSMKSPV